MSSVEIMRLLSQPSEIVQADAILSIAVAVAVPMDSPQLFVQAHAVSVGIGGNARVCGLTMVEVRNGISDFRKLRVSLPEHSQAAQLQLAFSLWAVVRGKLQRLDAISATSRPFIVAGKSFLC